MYELPREPETLTCPYCERVIPWSERLFIDEDWQDADGEWESGYTLCCESCFEKYA